MKNLIYSIVILLISHSIVLAQPNEYLTFEDNQIPSGWTFTPINSADISNGRLNAYTNDGRAKLSKAYNVESETQGFTIEWDAFVAYSFWGMGTHFSVFKGNERFIFSQQVEDNDYAADDLHLQIRFFDGTNQSLISEANIKFNEGVYHFKLVVNSSGYKFECFEEDNNEALQSLSLTEPENYFHFAEIDSILIDTYAHTDNNAWVDNIRITINPNDESDLIAYYPFNGSANDASGNGNDGTVNGATLTLDRFETENSAYNFDGIDDYISIPNNNLPTSSEPWTISGWIYPNDEDISEQTIIQWGNSSTKQLIRFSSQNNLFGPSFYNDDHYTQDIIENKWTFFAITYDGGTSVEFYIDDQAVESIALSEALNITLGNYPEVIGTGGTTNGQNFEGSIDDIRIYNYPLSNSEINELYNEIADSVVTAQQVGIGLLTVYADEITETSPNVFNANGNISIDSNLFFDGQLTIDKNELKLSGNGNIYVKQILNLDSINLYQGDFDFNVSSDQAEISSAILDQDNQQFDIINLPIYISGIGILDDGIEINGLITFPEVMGAFTAEIDQIKLTRSQGLDVVGIIELNNEIEIYKAVSLEELSFEFDTDKHEFRGNGVIITSLFEASAGVYIIEEGLDSVGVWVDLAYPKPLGTTGLALAGAGGYVNGIQIPPLTIGLGTTLVPVVGPQEFISFESLILEYKLGTSMTGSGNFVLFNMALANAYFKIEKERIALGVDVNFQDMILAYMNASIVKNEAEGIDFIGKFGGELRIPNKDGFEYQLYEALLRKVLMDETLVLPISLAGTDNVIYNAELSGRAWIVRPGKRDFRISYLLEYKNGEIKTDFARGYRLFNDEVFTLTPNGSLKLEYLNYSHPESRLEGKSLILKGSSNSTAGSSPASTMDQDFILSSEMEIIVVRVKGEISLPSFEITDPDGKVINEATINNFQNYDYVSNGGDNSSFIIIDFPLLGNYSIAIDDTGDNYLVDIIGNEGDPIFIINEINSSGDQINIIWSDDNPYDDADISFYYDDDKKGADGKPIVSLISEDNESDFYSWELNDELPGSYYIYGIMKDTLGNLVVNYFNTPVDISSNLEGPSNLIYQFQNDVLTLEWTKSVDCPSCDYLFFIDDNPNISSSSDNQNVGDTTNYSLSSLVYGRTYFISVAARNEFDELTSFSNTVEVELISSQSNNLPYINSLEYPERVIKGENVTIYFDIYDADDDTISLEAITAPSNISISSNTINWSAETVGEKQFFIKVSDQNDAGDSVRFFIEVYEEVFMYPSLSTNKILATNYDESVMVYLRNPALPNNESIELVQAYATANPDENIELELSVLESENSLFAGSIVLSKNSNSFSDTLKVSRIDTLVLSYSFNDEIIFYKAVFNGPNSTPENLSLSNLSIDENLSNELIGLLTASDYDNDDLEFSISSGSNNFIILDDSLKSVIGLNFEDQNSYDLSILVSDGNNELESDFTITVNDVNENPTSIFISSDTISENRPTGVAIGLFSSEDEDINDSFTYSISSGGEFFEIELDTLLSLVPFDFEESATQTLEITTTDEGGLTFTKSFDITILDVNEDVLGIDELRNDIDIYPNPFSDEISFIYEGNGSKSFITIYDMLGREIYKQRITNGVNTIILDDIAGSTFILKLSDSSGISTQKIIRKP